MSKKDMLGALMRLVVTVPAAWLGTLVDFIEKLLGKDGQVWFAAFGRFLRKENAWDGKKLLLRHLETLEVKGAKKFVAKEAFQIGTGPQREVPIISVGDNFKRDYIPKIEENVEDASVRIHELLETSRDIPIVAELGNEEGAETTLTHFHGVLAAKHAAGDHSWTVGYIRDKNGVLGVVNAYWDVVGWSVFASPLGLPDGWLAGGRVLSRNSVPLGT